MPLIGDNLLPEAAVSQRRSMRQRLRSLRDPLRSFRQDNIPGPNVIGQLEDRIVDTRDQFVSNDRVLSRLQDLRGNGGIIGNGDSGNGSNGSNGSGNSGGNSGSSAETSRRSQSNNPTVQ